LDPGGGTGAGFLFTQPAVGEWKGALPRAIQLLATQRKWRTMQLNAMAKVVTWAETARGFEELYRTLL